MLLRTLLASGVVGGSIGSANDLTRGVPAASRRIHIIRLIAAGRPRSLIAKELIASALVRDDLIEIAASVLAAGLSRDEREIWLPSCTTVRDVCALDGFGVKFGDWSPESGCRTPKNRYGSGFEDAGPAVALLRLGCSPLQGGLLDPEQPRLPDSESTREFRAQIRSLMRECMPGPDLGLSSDVAHDIMRFFV